MLTTEGEGFYPSCPSEFSRFSVSARVINAPRCCVELKEGMRPAAPEPQQQEEVPAPAVQEEAPAAAPAAEQAAPAAQEEPT